VFFNETINCERYLWAILRQFFSEFLSELTEDERLFGWFQQDSATAHIACVSMQAFSDVFGDRNISSDIWPAHSPDPNACNFFF
jgi:hypothetical protein